MNIMKKFLSLLFFVLAFNLFAQNYKTHRVEKGETIESIAKQYLVTPFDIYALNPDTFCLPVIILWKIKNISRVSWI